MKLIYRIWKFTEDDWVWLSFDGVIPMWTKNKCKAKTYGDEMSALFVSRRVEGYITTI